MCVKRDWWFFIYLATVIFLFCFSELFLAKPLTYTYFTVHFLQVEPSSAVLPG